MFADKFIRACGVTRRVWAFRETNAVFIDTLIEMFAQAPIADMVGAVQFCAVSDVE